MNQNTFQCLICPATKQKLVVEGNRLISNSNTAYIIEESGKIDFFKSLNASVSEDKKDFISNNKSFAKDILGKYYKYLVYIIAPVLPRIHWKSLRSYWHFIVNKYSSDKDLVVQIGSGNDRFNKNIINVDIFNYEQVDIVADCENLPFADESIDGIISFFVLEHVKNPEAAIKEAFRVLKPGGFILTGLPFIQGFHSSPHDFYRWTHYGLSLLHTRAGFKVKDIVPNSGPTSGFLWVFQEWLSIVLSFNIGFLYYFWWVFFSLTLWPLKLLDLLLVHYGHAYKINSSNILIGYK